MNIEFTQFLGLGHGSGGNFNRWLDNCRFHFQQAVSSAFQDLINELVVSLYLPGPTRGFGEPGLDVSISKGSRDVQAKVRLDPNGYGKSKDSSERICLIIRSLAELTSELGQQLDDSQDWTKIVAKVYAIENVVFE